MVSDNITKLRILVNELCTNDVDQKNTEDYKTVLFSIKEIVEVESNKVAKEHDKDNRLKCYEKMCSTIQIILNKIKIA